jgi:hypothetical protein
MTINHPVEWWQLAGVLLVIAGALRWYVPAMVESSVAAWADKERLKRRAEIEKERQEIALARVGRFQATQPPAEVSSGGV